MLTNVALSLTSGHGDKSISTDDLIEYAVPDSAFPHCSCWRFVSLCPDVFMEGGGGGWGANR